MLKTLLVGSVSATTLFLAASETYADAPQVVVSIPALHSLTASIMDGIAEPELLLPGNVSPHHASLRPSQAAMLQDADLIFWVSPSLETFLISALEPLAEGSENLAAVSLPGIPLLEVREGGGWEGHSHDHGDHGHDDDHAHDHDEHAHDDHADDHDEHAHDDHADDHDDHAHDHDDHAHDDHADDHDEHAHDDHGDDHDEHAHDDHADDHDEHAHDEHAHDHEEHAHDDHAHDHDEHAHKDDAPSLDELAAFDAHIWLDPIVGITIAEGLAAELAEHDPANAEAYSANLDALKNELTALDATMAEILQPVATVPYLVFHDAYQFLEIRYGLNAVGSVTVDPEIQPGAARMQELLHRVEETGAVCLFSEPQFSGAVVESIADGTGATVSVLDPLGAGLEPGADLYGELLLGLADSLSECLGS